MGILYSISWRRRWPFPPIPWPIGFMVDYNFRWNTIYSPWCHGITSVRWSHTFWNYARSIRWTIWRIRFLERVATFSIFWGMFPNIRINWMKSRIRCTLTFIRRPLVLSLSLCEWVTICEGEIWKSRLWGWRWWYTPCFHLHVVWDDVALFIIALLCREWNGFHFI